MTRTIKVDLFTDTVCPWCLVGSVRLDKAIAALPAGVTVDVENHPFYLNPDTPAEGVVVADMLRQKYGRDPREMWARVEGEAKASGIDLDLGRQPRSFRRRRAIPWSGSPAPRACSMRSPTPSPGPISWITS